MCPATKNKDGPQTTYNKYHCKFIELLFTRQYKTLCITNHASWTCSLTDIPASMCQPTKNKDGPQTTYSKDHDKFIK
jgi:hypothetical protein